MEPQQAPAVEIASILFLDIVGYSLLPMDRQSSSITELQRIVRDTEQYQQACAAKSLLSLPTGDGMAIVFFQNPVAPVECAIALAQALKRTPGLRVRIGVHNGPIHRHSDIRDELNVVGGGINMAQRVMDCGDAGHILLSQSMADMLRQLGNWNNLLHDLGECAVKHGVKVRVYSLYSAEFGNAAMPSKIRAQKSSGAMRNALIQFLPPIVLMLAIRIYFNTSEVTRDRPLGGAETFVVFLILFTVWSVILWLKRATMRRFRK